MTLLWGFAEHSPFQIDSITGGPYFPPSLPKGGCELVTLFLLWFFEFDFFFFEQKRLMGLFHPSSSHSVVLLLCNSLIFSLKTYLISFTIKTTDELIGYGLLV